MQQRRLRPGDILDDYCPRERRITNHVVVAMIEEAVKQTRCTTCDADHEYKQAKAPAPRRPRAGAALADANGTSHLRPSPLPAAALPEPPPEDAPEMVAAPGGDDAQIVPPAEAALDDEGPVHRRLIRATLPRPEGHVPERPAPEFTVRQPGARRREVDGNRQWHRQPRNPQGSGWDDRFGGRQGGGFGFGARRQGGRHAEAGDRGGRPPGGPGPGRGTHAPGSGRKRGR